jgi:hypothetical protein
VGSILTFAALCTFIGLARPSCQSMRPTRRSFIDLHCITDAAIGDLNGTDSFIFHGKSSTFSFNWQSFIPVGICSLNACCNFSVD